MTIVLVLIFLSAVICLLFLWRYLQVDENYEFMKKIPIVETSIPILGVALEFLSTEDVLNNLMRYMQTQGGLVQGKIGPLKQVLMVSDHKFLELVFNDTGTLKKSKEYYFLRPWLGTGLLTSDGPKWKKHRRVLTPAFHFKILEQFIATFESCGDILVKKLEDKLGEKSFDVYPCITLCSLDIICESIMGIAINAQSGENLEYVRSVEVMCKIAAERAISPIQMYDLLYPLTRNYYRQKKVLKILHQQTNDVINARRKELESKPEGNTDDQESYFKNKKPFLDILLQTTIDGRPLTHEEIREEVDTFMFEGHDTTASALSFTLFSLANHPDVQEKAFEEQKNIFLEKSEKTVTLADLQNMKYLELVIKESLRLYPSVPIYLRETEEDVKFGDQKIPKGLTVLIFAFGIHRNPKYFKDPEKFLPERFENSAQKSPYSYVPFSAGNRNCIGQKFAMLELKSVLSKVIRKYRLLPAEPHHEVRLLSEATLKSANGVNISLQLRE